MIALLLHPAALTAGERVIKDLQGAASAKGLQLEILTATTESEIDGAFVSLRQHRASALVVIPSAFFISRREQLAALALRDKVPAIYPGREFVVMGGLISYGPSLTAVFRDLGIYTGKILDGTKPGDLPVQQPSKFELVVNLNTAKALGITVPPSILARDDEVIE